MPLSKKQIEQRRLGLGASESAGAVGLSPFENATPVRVWMRKLGMEPHEIEETEVMYFGSALEDFIAKEFARRHGCKVRRRRATLKHPEYEWLQCHLDRTIDGWDAILECKNANHFMAAKFGESGTDDVPEYYLVQVYHQMMVTGKRLAFLAVLLGGNQFRWYKFEYDQELGDSLLARFKHFWHLVQTQEPPSPKLLTDVLQLYPLDSGTTLHADAELREWILEFHTRKIQMKQDEDKLKALELDIKGHIGTCSMVVDKDDTPLLTWKAHQERRLQLEQLKTDHPDLVEEYTKKSDVRVMRRKAKALNSILTTGGAK